MAVSTTDRILLQLRKKRWMPFLGLAKVRYATDNMSGRAFDKKHSWARLSSLWSVPLLVQIRGRRLPRRWTIPTWSTVHPVCCHSEDNINQVSTPFHWWFFGSSDRKKWTRFVNGARLTPTWMPVRGGSLRRACAFAYRAVGRRDKGPGQVVHLMSGWRLSLAGGPRGGPAPWLDAPMLIWVRVGLIPWEACATTCSSDQHYAGWSLAHIWRQLPETPPG